MRDALDGAGIDYVYRTKDLTSPTLLEGLAGGSSRGRTGTLGISHDARVEYKLYVHKDQLDWPKHFCIEEPFMSVLFEHVTAVTMDQERRILKDAYVAVEGTQDRLRGDPAPPGGVPAG